MMTTLEQPPRLLRLVVASFLGFALVACGEDEEEPNPCDHFCRDERLCGDLAEQRSICRSRCASELDGTVCGDESEAIWACLNKVEFTCGDGDPPSMDDCPAEYAAREACFDALYDGGT
jgi:hypothetical protein